MECCIHLDQQAEEDVNQLTEKSARKLSSCAHEWVELDGNEQRAAHCVITASLETKNGSLPAHYGFHRSCYKLFTDKTRIARAQTRVNKRKLNENNEGDSKRVCRSASNYSQETPVCKRERGLFHPVCVICKSTRNITVPTTSVRTQEKLVKCLTFDAQNTLKKSAKLKNDTQLRLLIEGEDLIAREAMYHKSCYRKYTQLPAKKDNAQDQNYATFCEEVVKSRILEGGEVLSMNSLNRLYLQICERNGNKEVHDSSNRALKRKLTKSHPNLLFLRVTNMSWSELVLPRNAKCSLTLHIDDDSDDEVEDDGSDDDIQDEQLPNCHVEMLEQKHQLFHSASCLREAVKATPKIHCPWPPTASDLTMESVAEIVPAELFNFLAHVIGFNTELPETGIFLEVPGDQQKKLLSVCQDIIYLAMKGLNPMPKHLALGLTVRHLTGSSKLIGILNGLGHCLSPTAVSDYDSALAQLIERDEIAIPQEITEQFTTLVFDNNDFGEETLTGKGTTHCTNGIVIQRSTSVEPEKHQCKERQPVSKARGQRPEVYEKNFEKMSIGKRQGPSCDFMRIQLEDSAKYSLVENKNIETAYIISKIPTTASQCLPSWSGFNAILYKEVPNKSIIGYLPVIPASPTRLEVVNEVLKKCICIADRLKQETVVLVVDQAIYSKAQQIRWLDPFLQERLVIRLGEFHTCMAFLAIIGKRFKDAGLHDILIESNLVAEGSLNGVFSGHHYNRSVRVMKVLYEAFYRLLIQALLEYLHQEEATALLKKAHEVIEAFNNGRFFEVVKMESFQDLVKELKEFSSVRSSESPTFQFWMSFIRMVETLLLFIRATRTGDWNLHVSAVRQMLPWFFAYDRINYARYLTVYWLEMINLRETHSTVHQEFLAGNFVTQQQSEHGFSQTAMDQTIEQTLNRDSKTKGGMTGITLKKNAVNCWILSFAERAKIQKCCEEMADRKKINRGRKELDQARIQRDEDDVQSAVSTIKAMTNPFASQDDELVNLASCKVAPTNVRLDLERAEKLGESELEKYIDQRMQKKELDMFSPLKAQKLKTFSDTGKSKGKEEVASMKASSQLMTRMLFIAKIKNLDMTDVLSFSLTPVPPSLGNYDGGLAKTNKAKLMNHLVAAENLLQKTSPGAIWIIDGMAYLQQLVCIPPTFGKLAEMILQGLVTLAQKCHSKRIDFVTDRYWQLSIKNSERDRRGKGEGLVTRINHPDQKIPNNFRKFLAYGQNKEALVAFIYRHWQECDATLYSDISVYLAHDDECHAFSAKGVKRIDALGTDHEEADTRLMLHAANAQRECGRTVIQTPDTDVFLLAVALNEQLDGEVEMSMGIASKRKNVSISAVCETLPSTIPAALLGFHTFTGCDTTSAFKGKGKIKAYKLMLENSSFQNAFAALGECWSTENLPWKDLETFVCELYGQGSASTLVEARTTIFKSCFKTDSSLPPTQDELIQHVKRANYQAAILKRALQQEMKIPSPCNHGWCLDEGQLGICWSTKPQAPDALLKEVFCKCKKTGCSSARCSCKSHGLKCTELCQCNECSNHEKECSSRVEEELTQEDEDEDVED